MRRTDNYHIGSNGRKEFVVIKKERTAGLRCPQRPRTLVDIGHSNDVHAGQSSKRVKVNMGNLRARSNERIA
jgi:hypothetical protein